MSLLQYGFKCQKINGTLIQKDEKNPKNPQVDLKNSNFNKFITEIKRILDC